ncbi:hypothetical protein [Motilibacter rhizosphaerae]|uniref:hypothetical protein n=1 Tax=Motilibacter rhizosphaerae TaxID=598652 RepID=UPI0013EE577F|nr:hypothetical protein [Motilibacter rhizosphaerae]
MRDLSVRAAIADMDGEFRSAPSTVGDTFRFTATDIVTSVLDGVAVVVGRVADALAPPARAARSAADMREPSRPDSAFEAVHYVSQVMGLPLADVTTAAGIAPRTFYSWFGGVTPRVQTQGSLWLLVQVAEDLLALLGTPEEVAAWIRRDPDRRTAFRAGDTDRLVAAALLDTRARAADPHRRAIAQLAAAGADRHPGDEPDVAARRPDRRRSVPADGRVVGRDGSVDAPAGLRE